MSKLIKLSDAVGEALAQRAAEDNLSMAGEVAKLLSVTELPPALVDTSYFDKKFDELKSLIEDTVVDRVSNGGPRTQSAQELVSLEWPDVQELLYEKMKEGDPEWFPGAYKGVTEEMQGDPICFSKDGVIYISLSGSDIPVLKVTPRVDAMLAEIIEGNINVA